jgi:RNA-directed DNA polymerase
VRQSRYKKLRGHLRRATHWTARISRRSPVLFAHWQMGAARLPDGSCMSREAHVQFCERLGARFPGATHLIVHCRTEKQAEEVRKAIAERLRECGLELHPEKTKIVYCKDDLRKGRHSNEKFDFMGYEFRPRRSKNRKGKFFINFSPAVSSKAAKAMKDKIRSWNLPKRSDKAIEDLSRMFNPIVRGWLQYYGRYYRSALYPIMRELDRDLAFWAKRKYKKLRHHLRRATHWIARISRRSPELFAHWRMGRVAP